MSQVTKNNRQDPVTKFCLTMEEFRRTDPGRVRSPQEFVTHFFPYDPTNATDRVFLHMPREVRAPIVSAWGIRGAKAAVRDDDAKVRVVVHDALLAGDIDAATFEEGVIASTLIDWVPLQEWWTFWRTGRVSGVPVQRALRTARELNLFDDRWFLQNLEGRGGRLKGTDTICDTLSKDQIVAWIRGIHSSGDGSPAGIVNALGWDTILTKVSEEALLFALDAFAKKVGLVPPTAATSATATSATSATAPNSAPTSATAPNSAPTSASTNSVEEVASIDIAIVEDRNIKTDVPPPPEEKWGDPGPPS